MKKNNGKPHAAVVDIATREPVETSLPEPVTALIPPGTKAAVDALTRLHLGTGTLADLAEIALAIHEGRTPLRKNWCLDVIVAAAAEAREQRNEAAGHNRWAEAKIADERRTVLLDRARKCFLGDL